MSQNLEDWTLVGPGSFIATDFIGSHLLVGSTCLTMKNRNVFLWNFMAIVSRKKEIRVMKQNQLEGWQNLTSTSTAVTCKSCGTVRKWNLTLSAPVDINMGLWQRLPNVLPQMSGMSTKIEWLFNIDLQQQPLTSNNAHLLTHFRLH